MIKSHSRPGGPAGVFLAAVLMLTLAGCADFPAWSSGSSAPSVAQVQAGRGIQANWVYYPAYEVYYSRNYRQYVYWDVTDWVTRLEPLAPLTPEILQASPAVRMNFPDTPATHHAVVAQRYPRNWQPLTGRLASVTGY
jgi:hypothetical protein